MTHRTTLKELHALCDTINHITRMPMAPYKREGGKIKPCAGCYFLDEGFGGVGLARMSLDEGCAGETHPLGLGYIPKRELADQLRAFIRGLEAVNNA